ncbi:MAG: hypothetical protein JNK74_11390 [Candidatus Hydrogenedentes bacterium]|nr:hypothetical protein [Candidatus Hydrogenedentota bacterium]
MRRTRGYILVEAVTAMAVLSITALTVQRAVHTAVLARGLAQDYTTAQFLLERIAADQSLQPRIAVGEEHVGAFPTPHDRFSYRWSLEKVDVPIPELPPGLAPAQRTALSSGLLTHMGRLRIEVHWNRGGEPFSAIGETLLGPDRIWIDPQASPP